MAPVIPSGIPPPMSLGIPSGILPPMSPDIPSGGLVGAWVSTEVSGFASWGIGIALAVMKRETKILRTLITLTILTWLKL